ncbi:FHA domain-containing protein [Schlesneria sp. T3-172]|uniref:FHA domain-containing protein n=1 Tax=Schlesneria sphaerica TaxID=3373610 RepID=UPI0037C55A61
MRAHLIPLKGGGAPIQITRDITLVGRQDDLCDICLETTSVSKMHCLIIRTDGLLFIRDLGSTNGTKVNGQRVLRGALLPGDELAFAGEKFRVEMGPGEPDIEPDPESQDAHTEEITIPPQQLVEYFAPYVPEKGDDGSSDSDVRFLDDEE